MRHPLGAGRICLHLVDHGLRGRDGGSGAVRQSLPGLYRKSRRKRYRAVLGTRRRADRRGAVCLVVQRIGFADGVPRRVEEIRGQVIHFTGALIEMFLADMLEMNNLSLFFTGAFCYGAAQRLTPTRGQSMRPGRQEQRLPKAIPGTDRNGEAPNTSGLSLPANPE